MVSMDGVGFRFNKQTRVRLRDIIDPDVYGDYAVVGNEGVVVDRRLDRFGLPEVLIEWDHDHWAYNGVPDCWTFEEHFELVEAGMDKKAEAQQAALDFANSLASILGGEETKESKPPTRRPAMDLTQRLLDAGNVFQQKEEEPDLNEEFVAMAAAAAEVIMGSEAFILIGARRNGDTLEPFALGDARDDKSELTVEAHLAVVAARAHQQLALQTIRALNE